MAIGPHPGTTTPIITVRGLRNAFGEQVIHEGLDLDVRRGEIIGVVGGSGTGEGRVPQPAGRAFHPGQGARTCLS